MKKGIKIILKIEYLPFLILFLIGLIVFWRLGSYGLADWDEAIYANISRNVARGHWLTLWYRDGEWFHKPPVYFWTTALVYKVFGINELSSRLVSAVSGMCLSYLIYLLTKKMFSNRVAIVAMVLILLNSFLLFQFRFGTTDVMALLFNTLSLYFFWLVQERKSNLLYVWIMLGIGGMVKGPIVLPVLLFMIIYMGLDYKYRLLLRSKYMWIGFFFFLIIVLPWHFYMFNKYGSGFYNEYFGYQIISRVMKPIEGHNENFFYYLRLVFENFPLAIGIFLLPLVICKRYLKEKKRQLCFIFLLFIVQYLSVEGVATKIAWYAIPLFVPLQILTAIYLTLLYDQWKIIGKILFILLLLLANTIEFISPYSEWKQYASQNDNKNCLLAYKQMKLDDYYIVGFDDPAVYYYYDLVPDEHIHQTLTITEVPNNAIFMVKDGVLGIEKSNRRFLFAKRGCFFAKKLTDDGMSKNI